MAFNSQSRGIASAGKRFAKRIWNSSCAAPPPFPAPVTSLRRGVHIQVSGYDKNVDDGVRPNILPDHVIELPKSDKYWAADPDTGVFGPAEELGNGSLQPHATNGDGKSVLEQKAFFRPLEDIEKPEPEADSYSLTKKKKTYI